MKLKVTNTKTGKVWIEENINHSWADLCMDIINEHKEFRLVYGDIEGMTEINDTWYILDECGDWEYLPEEYEVEKI
jgi:hypothetical protein